MRIYKKSMNTKIFRMKKNVIDYRNLYSGRGLRSLWSEPHTLVRRRSFGFLPQAGRLIDVLSVYENLAVAEGMKKSNYKNASGDPVTEILDGIFQNDQTDENNQDDKKDGKIQKYIHQSPSGLSGGYRQKLALERALQGNPDVIFMDEPTNHMDKEAAKATIRRLAEFVLENEENGKSVIVVTHDFDRIHTLAKEMFRNLKSDKLSLIPRENDCSYHGPPQKRGRSKEVRSDDWWHVDMNFEHLN